MSVHEIEKAEYMAFNEAMLRSTVGLAVNNNRAIGTGTLVSFKGRQFVLTAEHVISGANLNEVRYFIPPSTPLIEHSMRKGLPHHFEMPYVGDLLRMDGRELIDIPNDLAAIPLAPTSLMPSHIRFFPIESCMEAIEDGTSVLLVGFPVDNSAHVNDATPREMHIKALGLTSEHARFSQSLQNAYELPYSYNSGSHFLIEYSRAEDGITPPGFSGAAAWCPGPIKASVWAAQPMLAGVITRWFKKTAAHPDLLQGNRGGLIKTFFEQNV